MGVVPRLTTRGALTATVALAAWVLAAAILLAPPPHDGSFPVGRGDPPATVVAASSPDPQPPIAACRFAPAAESVEIAGSETGVDAPPPSGGAVIVTVTAVGVPIAGASVRVFSDGAVPFRAGETDAQGLVRFENLEEGDYFATAAPPNAIAPGARSEESFHVGKGETAHGVDLGRPTTVTFQFVCEGPACTPADLEVAPGWDVVGTWSLGLATTSDWVLDAPACNATLRWWAPPGADGFVVQFQAPSLAKTRTEVRLTGRAIDGPILVTLTRAPAQLGVRVMRPLGGLRAVDLCLDRLDEGGDSLLGTEVFCPPRDPEARLVGGPPDGSVRLRRAALPPGVYSVRHTPSGLRTRPVDLRLGGSAAEVSLDLSSLDR